MHSSFATYYSTVGFASAVPFSLGTPFVSRRYLVLTNELRAAGILQNQVQPGYSSIPRRVTISANSLEESKRRAKSSYDNIPDLNQQYLAELNWAERKYGPKVVKKNITKEAQKSILRPDGARAPRRASLETSSDQDSSPELEAGLSQYTVTRNRLLSDTVFLGVLGVCGTWGLGTFKDVQSFAVGVVGSLAYVYLLSRSVDRMADAAKQSGMSGGDALQPARIAILVLLVIASAKNREYLSVLPVLLGFFIYKVATLVPLLTGEAFD